MVNYMKKHQITAGEKPTVLIIDDSKAVQQYVKELLVKNGYSVAIAPDGYTGMECINRNAPDVILLDVEMPGMSGIEVLDVLNAEQLLFSIILFTTQSSLENRVKALNMGADDYITKPFEEIELLARVRSGWRTALLKKELASAKDQAFDILKSLHEAQRRLVEEQKLVAIARLAAGVAHQINNPLEIVKSNMHTLSVYARIIADGSERMLKMMGLLCDTDAGVASQAVEIISWMNKVKLVNIPQDIEPLLAETSQGIERIASIVDSMRFIDQANTFINTELEDLGSVVSSFTT